MVDNSVVIRDYQPGDDDAINALEKRASQHPKAFEFLLKAQQRHTARFDAKASQYDSHHILCVEDTKSGTLCGVVACGIKLVYLGGVQRKCGYVYDLRIDERYQRSGLGRRVSEELETRCRKNDVDFMYLTVNSDNLKAKTFYKKMGFTHASHRAPFMGMLMNSVAKPAAYSLVRGPLGKDEALQMYEKEYPTKDMRLVDLRPLFESSLFQGALVVEDGSSAAGACLWNAGSFYTYEISRIILPVQWYTYVSVKAFLLGATALVAYGAISRIHKMFLAGHFLSFTISSIGCSSVAFGAYKFVTFARWASDFILGRSTNFRSRLFGAWSRGPQGTELLKNVVAKAQNIAFEKGYLFLICNLDADEPCRVAFPQAAFRTNFLLKPLNDSVSSDGFAPDNFHDPRDI